MLPILFVALFAAVSSSVVYVLLIWWLDRYEREPLALLATTFMWGAVPAIIIALVVELALAVPLGMLMQSDTANTLSAVLVAPVVEEFAKALALFGLIIFFRTEIDGLLDGIVYGALIGAGFAMTENFFYFVSVAFEGGWRSLAGIILLRSVVFGLSHALFTAISGLGMAFALKSSRPGWRWLAIPITLALAIFVHFWHNLTLTATASNGLAFVLTVIADWGGVLLLLIIAGLALRTERQWIRRYLAPEVPDVLNPEHYRLIQSQWPRLGRIARWLRGVAWHQASLQAQMHQTAMELAFHKQRRQRTLPKDQEALSAEIMALRKKLADLDRQLQQT